MFVTVAPSQSSKDVAGHLVGGHILAQAADFAVHAGINKLIKTQS